jgi:hypothetical protein
LSKDYNRGDGETMDLTDQLMPYLQAQRLPGLDLGEDFAA